MVVVAMTSLGDGKRGEVVLASALGSECGATFTTPCLGPDRTALLVRHIGEKMGKIIVFGYLTVR